MIFKVGSGSTELTYEIKLLGQDLLIMVSGGQSHIGCVAVGDKGSLLNYVPNSHKDHYLALDLAKAISQKYQNICTVIAGFHLEQITPAEIALVLQNHQEGSRKISELLEEGISRLST